MNPYDEGESAEYEYADCPSNSKPATQCYLGLNNTRNTLTYSRAFPWPANYSR